MSLHLTLTTPLRIEADVPDVASLRAEDASGDFGIQPGHADFLTVIGAGVMRWRAASGPWQYAALRGAVLSVHADTIRVAAREAILSDDLSHLRTEVSAARARAEDTRRSLRSQSARLHARAIRQLMRQLGPGGDTLGLEEAGT